MLITRWNGLEKQSTSDNPRPSQDDLNYLLNIINLDNETSVIKNGEIGGEYRDVLMLKYDNVPLISWFLKGGHQHVQKRFSGVHSKFKEVINLWEQGTIPGVTDEDIESGPAGLWFLENSQDIDIIFSIVLRRWNQDQDVERLFSLISDERFNDKVSEILGIDYQGTILAHWFLQSDYTELVKKYPIAVMKLGEAIRLSVESGDGLDCRDLFESWKEKQLYRLLDNEADKQERIRRQWGILKMYSKAMMRELLLHLKLNPGLAWQDKQVRLDAKLSDVLYYALDITGKGVTLQEVSEIILCGGSCDEMVGTASSKRYRLFSAFVNLCESTEDIGLISDLLNSPNISQVKESFHAFESNPRVITAGTVLDFMDSQVADIIKERRTLITRVQAIKGASSVADLKSQIGNEVEQDILIGIAEAANGIMEKHNRGCIKELSQLLAKTVKVSGRGDPDPLGCWLLLDRVKVKQYSDCMDSFEQNLQLAIQEISVGEVSELLKGMSTWYQPSSGFLQCLRKNYDPQDKGNDDIYSIDYIKNALFKEVPEESSQPDPDQSVGKPKSGFTYFDDFFRRVLDLFNRIAQWFRSKFELKHARQDNELSGGLGCETHHNPVFSDGDPIPSATPTAQRVP